MPEQIGILPISEIRVNHRARADTESGGHIRYESVKVADVAPDSEGTFGKSWPYDVDIESGMLYGVVDSGGASAQDPGDAVAAWAQLIVGALGADAAQAATIITVNATAIAAVDVGDYVKIGVGADEYEVVAKDEGASTLTLATGLAAAATSGDLVTLLRYFIGVPGAPLELGPNGSPLRWGDDTFDGARLPSSGSLNIKFVNSSSTKTKTMRGHVAILY